jgi:hypothetical protein
MPRFDIEDQGPSMHYHGTKDQSMEQHLVEMKRTAQLYTNIVSLL